MPKTKNPVLVKGVNRYGRYAAYKAKSLFKRKLKVVQPEKIEKKQPRQPRFYDTENPVKRLYSRKHRHNPPKFRKSLQPGAVLILLSGKFRGRRVILLNRLPSGLLLVNGPYSTNGVPLKRVNPAYVIATSTSVDLNGFQLDGKFNDDYFVRPKKKRESKSSKPEERFDSQEKKEEEPKKKKLMNID